MLQPAINCGMLETDFWLSTPAEIDRFIKGCEWRYKQQATYDYILGDLIGKSVSRLMDKNAEYPPIEDVYTNLFDKKEIQKNKQEERTQKSINNFLNAAMAINRKRNEAPAQENEEVES